MGGSTILSPLRLVARISAFQAEEIGSIPLGATNLGEKMKKFFIVCLAVLGLAGCNRYERALATGAIVGAGAGALTTSMLQPAPIYHPYPVYRHRHHYYRHGYYY